MGKPLIGNNPSWPGRPPGSTKRKKDNLAVLSPETFKEKSPEPEIVTLQAPGDGSEMDKIRPVLRDTAVTPLSLGITADPSGRVTTTDVLPLTENVTRVMVESTGTAYVFVDK